MGGGGMALARSVIAFLCVALGGDAGAKGLQANAILWRLERSGFAASYLFGTAHSSAPDIVALSPKIRTVFAAADSVVGEADIPSMRARLDAAKYAAQPEDRIAAMLDPPLLDALLAMGPAYGFEEDKIAMLAPWYVLAVMATSDSRERGRRAAGAKPDDELLQDMARAAGKLAPPLETTDEHLAVFTEMARDDQLAMLRQIIRSRSRTPQVEAGSEMLELYRRHDLEAMRKRFLDSLQRMDEPQAWWRYWQRVQVERNRKFVERLETDYFPSGSVFVAVGAGHLAGDDGMIALLQQRGWTATPIE
jgi:uncharacterized protein